MAALRQARPRRERRRRRATRATPGRRAATGATSRRLGADGSKWSWSLLCTVPEAKAQIGLDHDLDDAMVEEMIEAASGAVINYLKGDADRYLDSSGNLGTDTSITDPPDFAPGEARGDQAHGDFLQ